MKPQNVLVIYLTLRYSKRSTGLSEQNKTFLNSGTHGKLHVLTSEATSFPPQKGSPSQRLVEYTSYNNKACQGRRCRARLVDHLHGPPRHLIGHIRTGPYLLHIGTGPYLLHIGSLFDRSISALSVIHGALEGLHRRTLL